MRVLTLLSLAACASCLACAQQPSGNDAAAAKESANSPAAKEAQALARRYMTLINAKDYAAARAMWGHDGADVGGSTEDFARTFAPFSRYEGEIGDPTELKTSAGEQFVAVSAKAHVTLQKTGEKRDLVGLIRFRRPADGAAKNPGQEKWTIWAVDLRKPH